MGTAIISAVSDGKTGSAKIAVFAAVETVTINPALDTLETYDTLQVSAALRDAKGRLLSDRVVRWTSSNPAVATINSITGRLAGIDRGTVTVTATSETKIGTTSRVVVIRYRSVSAGTMHVCDIASGGIAWCWGLNGNEGRLGSSSLGVHANSSTPFAVPGGHRFIQLATYARTTCGIARDGNTYCWGYNGFGALGDGSGAGFSSNPTRVSGSHRFVKLVAGLDFACGLESAGALFCWGCNGWGQFGNNTTSGSNVPVAAASGMAFATIAAGSTHVCGVTASGTYCWGADGQGQLGDGGALSGGNTFAKTPKATTGGHLFQSVAAGNLFSCGRTSSGQGYCWGSGADGKLGNSQSANTSTPAAITGGLSFQSLAAGYGHACGVASGGALYCWGANRSGNSDLRRTPWTTKFDLPITTPARPSTSAGFAIGATSSWRSTATYPRRARDRRCTPISGNKRRVRSTRAN